MLQEGVGCEKKSQKVVALSRGNLESFPNKILQCLQHFGATFLRMEISTFATPLWWELDILLEKTSDFDNTRDVLKYWVKLKDVFFPPGRGINPVYPQKQIQDWEYPDKPR